MLSLTDNLLLLHRSSSSIEDVQYSEFVVKMEIGIGQEPNQGHLQKKARVYIACIYQSYVGMVWTHFHPCHLLHN